MDAFLLLTLEERRHLCEAAAAELGLNAASVEKDVWVCRTLRQPINLPDNGEAQS